LPVNSRARVLTLLEREPLRHIVGLKMLERAGDAADVRLREDAAGWAASIGFEASAFEYDAQTYGRDARIVLPTGRAGLRSRQGLAARVVRAALAQLLAVGALPRHQTSAANPASLALARSIGLVEFLRIEHVRIGRTGATDGRG